MSASSYRRHFIMWQLSGQLRCLVLCWCCVVLISCLGSNPNGIIQSSFIAIPVGNKTGQSWNKLLPPKEQHKQNKIELLHYKHHAEIATTIRLLWEKAINASYLFNLHGLKIFSLTAENICRFWKYLDKSFKEAVYKGCCLLFKKVICQFWLRIWFF